MMILARYVLREHIGPFIFAFVIITFILILDFIPDLVEMVVGKDLSAWIIFKVFIFQFGWIVALSVPMSVLVATLMAYGRMTNDLEITAVKAAGVPVIRVIMPVLLASLVVGAGMVVFNNRVLPDMNHRARVLMQDIRRLRPTLQIRSGAFVTDIPGYIILIDSVNHTTSDLKGVKILELAKGKKAPRTIVAESGHMEFAPNGNDLIFDLRNGEIHEYSEQNQEDYRRVAFAEQRILVRDVSREFEESADDFRTDREKSAQRMLADIEKWKGNIKPYRYKITNIVGEEIDRLTADSLPQPLDTGLTLTASMEHLKRAVQSQVLRISREADGVRTQQKMIDSYLVEVHKKYALPTACVVFVLIGAPLGVIARRGSMGISIGISLGLFILYWAFLIGGEDLADRGMVEPWLSMWAANILIGGIGLYLIYIVSTEQPFWGPFDLRAYRRKSR
jgi:lipopolysaccharide export system permease protein